MRIIVLGSGNWGTTLSIIFSQKNDVVLWTINSEEARIINEKRENVFYLPGIKLPDNMVVEEKFSSPIAEDDILILAVPSRKIEAVASELKANGFDKGIIINVSKGVKHSTLKTISEIITETFPAVRFANLTGPTISREIAEGLPAKAILASRDLALLFHLQDVLDNPLVKFEFSRDVEGVELAASLKGIIAIAVGMADGFSFKTNIFGLIITYGLNEFITVMNFLGVRTKTAYSIAGIGDLITTCLSENSRNRSFGKLLAEGYSRDIALEKVGMEVEGVSMAKTIRKLASFNLSIPLITTIAKIIFDDVEDIKSELLNTLNTISS